MFWECGWQMRTFKHWSPYYLKDRCFLFWYHRKYPLNPWLTPLSISILEFWLKNSDSALEFGSGRSTIWLAKRVKQLTSIEEDSLWFEHVQYAMQINNIRNVTLFLRPQDVDENDGFASQYVRIMDSFAENSFDFILIDGIYRDACACEAVNKIRSNGVLVIDDVQRYLPSDSRSPAARSRIQGAAGQTWTRFQNLVSEWRTIWTSSGVTDTAFFFKP